MQAKRTIVTGLDLGTTKVCAVIAEKLPENKFNILGYGLSKSEGLHKGLVNNIPKTIEAIKTAMNAAMQQAGIQVTKVNVGVAGEHITSMRHRNFVTITNPEHEITREDLHRLEMDVRSIRLPMDMQILHVLPEEFIVDQLRGVTDPLGFTANRLEATNHVVLASTPAIMNIQKSVEKAGFQIESFILQPIASAASVLSEEEKDLGVLMMDIGGGTTDVAIIHRKTIIYSKVFGMAGNQVTNDIREALSVINEEAEKIKREHGYACESAIIKNYDFIIKGVGAWGSTKVEVSLLTQIINARMKELFMLVENDVRASGFKNRIKAGIILTGGGSLLRGTNDLALDIFHLPARFGIPLESWTGSKAEIEKPEFATVIGLLFGAPGAKEPEPEPEEKKQWFKKKETKKKVHSPNIPMKKQEKSVFRYMWDNVKEFFNRL